MPFPARLGKLTAAAIGVASIGTVNRAAREDHVHSGIGIYQKLFSIPAANMNVTTDQIFTRAWAFTDYEIGEIRVRDASISLTTAAGGIYNAITKPGAGILVAAAQAYAALTGATLGLSLTLTALAKGKQTATPYLSLTTAQGAAATATVEIWGIPLATA